MRIKHLLLTALTAATAATVIVVTGGPASANEATRPFFQLPFSCGSSVRMETGPTHDNYHNGVWRRDKAMDMYNPPAAGTAVRASAAGTVSYVSGSSTNAMYVVHSGGWRTMYAHMSGRIANGSWVNRGQQIGVVDNVGTGVDHLHYEQQYNGTIAYPKLNGRMYKLSNGDPYVLTRVSHLCSGFGGVTWCRYRVSTAHDERSWAAMRFEAEGWAPVGLEVTASLETYSFDNVTWWRRTVLPVGADQSGSFLRSAYLVKLSTPCFN